MMQLVSSAGDQTYEMESGRPFIVGRAVTSDIRVYDPTVSRRHAQLTAGDGSIHVEDFGSSNGTFINGERVTKGAAEPGDVVTFGKVSYHVQVQQPPPPAFSEQLGQFPSPHVPGATIVRAVPVEPSGGIPAIMDEAKGGATVFRATPAGRREKKLSLLLEISKELSRQQSVDRLLEKVVDFTFQIMSVDRVSILLPEQGTKAWMPRISKNRTGSPSTTQVPQSIVNKAVADRVAILSDNAVEDDRFMGQSILMQSVRSAMCTPLMGSEDNVLGILYVDNLTITESFSDEDLEFLMAFGGLAAVAIENSRLAEQIQRDTLVRSNFQRYFAPELAEQILSHKEAIQLGGQKQPVVIFFSDIRGFTPLSEMMHPDHIASLLTEYFTEMVEIVFEHGGVLDKFMGDAIMALWGAPLQREDDADRAMRAAIEQIAALAKLNEMWESEGRPQLAIGVGINYGEVFAGNIGSERRLEYTVIGDAVNTASRICSAARENEILISEAFYQQLKSPPEVIELEPIPLKGKAKNVPVYRVKV